MRGIGESRSLSLYNSSMKIYHVTTFSVSQEIRQHIINIVNLENAMGHRSQWEQTSTSFIEEGRIDCDFVHIHGFPIAEYAIKIMTLIKNLMINKVKFVISMYDYSAICRTSILRDSCNPLECNNEDCIKSRSVFSFIKSCPIFVYSEACKQKFIDNGYSNVVLQPINYYGAIENFPLPEFDEDVINRVGIYDINPLFDREISFYSKFKKDNDLKIYDLEYFSKFEANFVLDYKKWPSSFPIEMGYSLATGVPVIADNEYPVNEYSGIGTHYFDLDEDGYDDAIELMHKKQSYEHHQTIAYEFWKHHGPDKCVAWYEATYRDLMRK